VPLPRLGAVADGELEVAKPGVGADGLPAAVLGVAASVDGWVVREPDAQPAKARPTAPAANSTFLARVPIMAPKLGDQDVRKISERLHG
jgi:hypothetical protein